MQQKRPRYWRPIVHALAVLVLAAGLVVGFGLQTASADGPAGGGAGHFGPGPGVSGGLQSGGSFPMGGGGPPVEGFRQGGNFPNGGSPMGGNFNHGGNFGNGASWINNWNNMNGGHNCNWCGNNCSWCGNNFNWNNFNNCNCNNFNWNWWNRCNCNNNWNWWNWNRCNCNNFNNFFPIVQPITYPVYTPVPVPVYGTAPVYNTQAYTWMSYGPGWQSGWSSANIQALCQQYNAAVAANPAAYNASVQTVCNTSTVGTTPSIIVQPSSTGVPYTGLPYSP